MGDESAEDSSPSFISDTVVHVSNSSIKSQGVEVFRDHTGGVPEEDKDDQSDKEDESHGSQEVTLSDRVFVVEDD